MRTVGDVEVELLLVQCGVYVARQTVRVSGVRHEEPVHPRRRRDIWGVGEIQDQRVAEVVRVIIQVRRVEVNCASRVSAQWEILTQH